MGFHQMLFLEKSIAFPCKNFRAHILSNMIINRITQYCRNRQYPGDQSYVKLSNSSQRSQRENQGIAGKKRGDNETCLAEYDQKHEKISQRPILLDDVNQMSVNVHDKADKPSNIFH